MRVVEYVLLVASLLVAGLVVSALLWSGTGPYEDLMKGQSPQSCYVYLFDNEGRESCYILPRLVEYHRAWSAYETGATDSPPTFSDVRFTDEEYAHMADVRGVFDAARFLVPFALFVLIVRLQRARARSAREMWALVRNGSLIAAAAVAVIGVVATFAFDPLFLAFHELFFPQGNFLFPPTSNLIRLYPDWYWQGITLRVGLSFIAIALVLAGLAHLRLRRLLT